MYLVTRFHFIISYFTLSEKTGHNFKKSIQSSQNEVPFTNVQLDKNAIQTNRFNSSSKMVVDLFLFSYPFVRFLLICWLTSHLIVCYKFPSPQITCCLDSNHFNRNTNT